MLQHSTIFCNFAQILQDSARFHRIPIGTTKFHYILQFNRLFHIWDKDILATALLGQRYLGQRNFGQVYYKSDFMAKDISAPQCFFFIFLKNDKNLAAMSLAKISLVETSLWLKHLSKCLWPKFRCPKFLWPKSILVQSVFTNCETAESCSP